MLMASCGGGASATELTAALDELAIDWPLFEEIIQEESVCIDADCPSALRRYTQDLDLDETESLLAGLLSGAGYTVEESTPCRPDRFFICSATGAKGDVRLIIGVQEPSRFGLTDDTGFVITARAIRS